MRGIRVPGQQCGSGEPLEGVWRRTEGRLCGQMLRGEDETRTDGVTTADSEPATPEPLTPAESGLTPRASTLEQQVPLVISQGGLITQLCPHCPI